MLILSTMFDNSNAGVLNRINYDTNCDMLPRYLMSENILRNYRWNMNRKVESYLSEGYEKNWLNTDHDWKSR